ncbi:MAG TPA: hypothetical protein VMS55_19060 [Myxococcota bacterium]|nr:hypothetical protein [Myxococcota bacterium]
MRSNGLGRVTLAFPLLFALGTLGCGADTLVTGIGNGGNVIGADVLDRVAHELARQPAIPLVGDDELRVAFAAIRDRARSGDPDAALVLLRVAAIQREAAKKQ